MIERYSVQNMNKIKNQQDYFKVLRKIQKKLQTSQREFAEQLGFSLRKLKPPYIKKSFCSPQLRIMRYNIILEIQICIVRSIS